MFKTRLIYIPKRVMPAECPKPETRTMRLANGNNSSRRVNSAGTNLHNCAAASLTQTFI